MKYRILPVYPPEDAMFSVSPHIIVLVRGHSRVPPFLKGGNPIFEFFKKGGEPKKILGWGKKRGGKIFKNKGGEPNFVS